MRLTTLIPWLLALLLPGALHAQSARWDPPGGTLPVGQVTALQLVFQDCEPKETPVPPKVDGLTLEFTGQASNISWVNGDYSRSITYTFAALLATKQGVDLPGFTVPTNKGVQRVAAAHFDPTDATVGSTGQSLEAAASSHLELNPASVWAGEVFSLSYRVDVARSYYPDFGRGDFAWNPAPLIAEDWDHPEPYTAAAGSDPRTGFTYRTRALARVAGSYRLNPINQLVNLSVGVTGFGFFQQRQYQQFSIASNAATVEVRPLPPAPAGFSGAVGDFKLVSKVVPTTTTVGEPVTWTLELSGTGNWSDISGLPAREVSRTFQVVQPKAKRVTAPGKLFTATLAEDVVLVPTAAGTYPLEPFHFTYFDPHTGTYRTLTTDLTTVAVAAPAASAGAPAGGPPAAEPAAGGPAPESPGPPSALPRDPLPGPASAPAPWGPPLLLAALLAPFALGALVWLGLALRRARATDPRRAQREAHHRLAAVLRQLREAKSASALLAWQRDAALFAGIAHAAPTAAAFDDPAWAALWADADRALYGPAAALPADWIDRAAAALQAQPAPSFRPLSLFRRQNLMPWFFALILVAAGARPVRAVAPASSYRQGGFAEAEQGWRAAAARDPRDWTARYNLSLALAQQNRWDEAAAQAAAAFVQHPDDASVRWQFALACDKAGFAPEPLSAFLAPGPLQALGRLASPADWQRVAALAAILAAGGLVWLLAVGYGGGGRRSLRAGAGLVGAALLLGATAAAGWHAYGSTHDTRAVVVWHGSTLRSIPTEADAAQKTTPLGAGSVAVVDKTFLGWARLAFGNGQTGWVRQGDLVGIWR